MPGDSVFTDHQRGGDLPVGASGGHEAQHLRGVRNEGLANCYGFQDGVQIGVNLGLSESRARAMMREQLATNPSDSAGNPAYRVPSGCRSGGAEDLHPAEPEFP